VTISSVVLQSAKTGTITMVSDKADASGKFLTEVSFSNNGRTEKLKAGMIADVYFPMESTERGLSIPVSALIGSAADAKVFVVNGNKVELRRITTGVMTPTTIQVTEGLQAGDKVVISGQVNLENGTTVSVN